MDLIKTSDSKLLIPTHVFNVCLKDGLTLKDICELYTRDEVGKPKSCYKLDKFIYHLKTQLKMTIQDYCNQYLNFDWPKCPIKNTLLGYKINGQGILISKFAPGAISKETCPKFAEACKRFSEERKGENNPMWGKTPWNTGLTAETDERVKMVAEKRIGMTFGEESRAKMRKRRAESPIKARHTTPHSPETVEAMRFITAKRWAEGAFNKVTSIHIKMREFLNTLSLKSPLKEEFQVWYFSMDFAFPERKVAIECQGTYFHIDPRIYPNGPQDAIQRRNFGRDAAKKKICCGREGWTIIEVWETEINDGSFKESLKCKLKELNLLND